MARLVFDGPPTSQWDDNDVVSHSVGGGYVRAKHRHLDTGRHLATKLPGLPFDNFYMVADDITLAIRSHCVRADVYHERIVP